LHRQRGTAYLLASLFFEKLHDGEATLTAARKAAEIYEPLKSDAVSLQLLARAYLQAGKGCTMAGKRGEGREWLGRSVEAWQAAESHGKLTGTNAKLAAEAGEALAAADKRR
jgi:hypothetical protein